MQGHSFPQKMWSATTSLPTHIKRHIFSLLDCIKFYFTLSFKNFVCRKLYKRNNKLLKRLCNQLKKSAKLCQEKYEIKNHYLETWCTLSEQEKERLIRCVKKLSALLFVKE